jgi:hypothetical protein
MTQRITVGVFEVLASANRITLLADHARSIGADEVASTLDRLAARQIAFAAGLVGGLASVASSVLAAAAQTPTPRAA